MPAIGRPMVKNVNQGRNREISKRMIDNLYSSPRMPRGTGLAIARLFGEAPGCFNGRNARIVKRVKQLRFGFQD